MEANTACFTTCIPTGILWISQYDAASSQTVRMEVALFHCGCMKGALSHQPVTCQTPLRDHWGLPENWIFYSSPWRDLQTSQPYSPGGRTGCCLERSLPMASGGHQGSLQASLLPIEGLGYEAGDEGMDFHAHKAVLGFASGKMSPVIQGVMVYFTFWWSGTTDHFWSPTAKSLWLHIHIQGLLIIINTNLT